LQTDRQVSVKFVNASNNYSGFSEVAAMRR